MDIAVNLVESYLRLNGYLTLSEFEVTRRREDGQFETVTDVDIMAMRLPGDTYAGDPHDDEEFQMLLIDDPVLELAPEVTDVIIGEVKQGDAEFNDGNVIDLATDADPGQVLALDEAMTELERDDPRAASVVRMRFYAGLDVEETANVLGLSERTVLRDWAYARARLFSHLTGDEGGPDDA